MTNRIRNSSQLAVWVLIIMISAFGCKSSKKAIEAQEQARIEQEATLRQQQEAEAKRKAAEQEEKEKELRQREAEAKLKEAEARASTPRARLDEYFKAISSSTNVTSANTSINEALSLFASPETLVLVVISESGGQKDYDRPTTIKDYLNYIKDQNKNINTISDLKFDSTGKITELELRKPF